MTRQIAERLLRATGFTEFQIRRLIDGRDTLDADFIAQLIEIKMGQEVKA